VKLWVEVQSAKVKLGDKGKEPQHMDRQGEGAHQRLGEGALRRLGEGVHWNSSAIVAIAVVAISPSPWSLYPAAHLCCNSCLPPQVSFQIPSLSRPLVSGAAPVRLQEPCCGDGDLKLVKGTTATGRQGGPGRIGGTASAQKRKRTAVSCKRR
jgi:hypothetical protein